MSNLTHLENQITSLNTLNRSSAKALDTFADTSNAIAVRARQITRDVKPWEVAQENIALTIEEMSKAARCYHPPPTLHAVLSKRDANPEAVARCIDYLVYTDDYLSSHPPNAYGDDIHTRTELQLRQVVAVSEELVKTTFLRALQRPVLGAASPTAPMSPLFARPGSPRPAGDRGLIVKSPAALDGIGLVIQRLGENFNRTEVLQDDVRRLLQDRVKTFVERQFDAAYREDEAGKPQISKRSSMAPVVKHYQRGDHRLIGISKLARQAVAEVSDCVNTHIVVPLDNDYAVAEIPSLIAGSVFDIVMARALTAVHFDVSVFANPTKMFIESRGQGIGLYPGVRYFRDFIFIGLDLIQELWQWKSLASSTPGERDGLIDHVDNEIETFIFRVRDLLDGYVSCQGALDKAKLRSSTLMQNRTEWLPSVDCTAHESTTNVMYFHKMLLSSYFGSFKIALVGNTLGANSEEEAVREVEDYLIRCVLGTIQELVVVAETALKLQEESAGKGSNRFVPRTGVVGGTAESDGVRLSPPIFLLNNVIFLEENYRREPCFMQRTMKADEPIAAARARAKRGGAEPPPQPIVQHILAMLADEKEQYIDDFVRSWESCFPTNENNPDLASINPDANQPLRKSQRMAVKRWHKRVADLLNMKLRDCRVATVMSSARARLVELSLVAVQEHFAAFDDVIQGRAWSSRPQKWISFTRDDVLNQVKKIF